MKRKRKRSYGSYNRKKREEAVKVYQERGWREAIAVCHVPRNTLYRWVARQKTGEANWAEMHSKRPKRLARRKVTLELERQIIALRQAKTLYKQIPSKLPCKLAISTICRVWLASCKRQQGLPNCKTKTGNKA